jgi:Uma2 family endonuclease
MPALPKIRRFTPEEYLAIDRAAPTKSEYHGGEIFAMAGASEQHNIITLNVATELRVQLRGGPCRPFSADMRVRIGTADLYAYPHVVVVCGERRFADDQRDVLLNPTAIIEVLAEGTEAYDRGDIFAGYRHAALSPSRSRAPVGRCAASRRTRSEGDRLGLCGK